MREFETPANEAYGHGINITETQALFDSILPSRFWPVRADYHSCPQRLWQRPIPVVAAGGMADGRGLAAALVLGATGISLGTRFLASQESPVSQSWKQKIVEAESEDSVKFDAWNNISPPQRCDAMAEIRHGRHHEVLPAAGQSVGLINDISPAADIVHRLIEEAERALRLSSELMAYT